MKNKKAQVWIETVLYTLIGIAIIGILLAAAKPKIDSMKDKLIIDQTIESLNNINSKIIEATKGPTNKRIIELKVSKGEFTIDPSQNKISWILDSTYQYSEPDTEVNAGNIKVKTTKVSPYQIELWLTYNFDITADLSQNKKTINSAPTPYTLYIENMGIDDNGNTQIDISVK